MNPIHAPITPGGITPGRAIHASLGARAIHAPITPITDDEKTAGQAVHASNHAIHGTGNHVFPHPFRDGETCARKVAYVRRRALIIGGQTNESNQRTSVTVRCPFCRGIHQHAWGHADYAAPWCGTPGAVYRLVWPEAAKTNHPDELT